MAQIDPFSLPFTEAIAYFKSKTPLPSTAWDDFADAAQDHAFTVASVTSGQLLGDVYNLVLSGLENGDSYGEFKKGFDQAIDKAGWNPANRGWRTNIIFMTNLRQAYAAGRYKQMSDPEVLKLRPYWRYQHGDSRVPRPAHLSLDGKIYPADSPFWQTCFAPNGFGCRCRIFSLSQREIEREGLTVDTPPQETVAIRDKVTGELKRVPSVNGQPIAEPGFTTIPGSSEAQNREQVLQRGLDRLPSALREQAIQAIKNRRDH
ncbi:MAG: phage head morphogenesis protein [Cyanomargarita calcarea GSE-NOS-MK-12-04C]|jgi:SPP1 gp7 family putative phage head morphogenesis protein|uniref:Phage head morphogenesis protein n=1 Tax=Cyanomargarita calcarea GSE-NOS-MK-12-04C TaxID=2839659 RepID=A0A951QPP1_9CYAN|nr:phage head morphogenesis protein [Cyanomargarita calcarea GSE-NOS-MK-12-04C]